MIITKADIISKIRKAIDDIVPSGVTDSFVSDVDAELWQATQQAVNDLLVELPINLLDATEADLTGTIDTNRGFAYDQLPDDFYRFVSIDITGTAGVLFELIEQGSDQEKMQRSAWSRGSATKPKAMMDHDEQGNKVIVWWPGDSEHNSAQLWYIELPELVTTATTAVPTVPAIVCAIRAEAEQQVIYRAASIFFEGKKEADTADRFKNL